MDGAVDEYPYDLGTYTRPVTTSSAAAQRWFDRGLIWCYGFNHEEAVRCFERALEHDPACAMASWGIAYAVGPNYNRDWVSYTEQELPGVVAAAHAAARRALQSADAVTALERDLIDALQHRYPAAAPVEDCAVWNDAYAAAMREVYERFGGDADVATLFAEALMTRTPWELWETGSGRPAEGADTAEAVRVLERAMAETAHPHAGMLHMYVHAMEMSPTPERALPAADLLRDMVPDAGHLQHMPTHIDVLCGRYLDVVVGNERAIVADRSYLAHEGALNFYTLYRCHDLHFKVYGAMFLGRPEPALEAAEELIANVPEWLLRDLTAPWADLLEGFLPVRLHVLVRFGRWQEILAEPLPADPELYCTTTAMLHYARGVALAVTDQVEAAERERALFGEAVERVPDTRYLFNNTCRDILAVAGKMLSGELAYRQGEFETAFAHLRHAVALDDGLPYDEPWGWMQPTRHALGALLLEQGRSEEAEAVYRADLGLDETLARPCRHPDNVWSLHGYHESLVRNGKAAEADRIRPKLEAATAAAGVPIGASCACRLARTA